ncbi:hypothetical protein COCON_G00165650 [Conger conger]|uniref:Aryl hydrocarbon receptor n=1 Tax=Conger conger TaxID=82655 RepID=A0A9Q1D6P6_CONCO|nr:hypothetical protein COCON_G00165650 [Conger conger]
MLGNTVGYAAKKRKKPVQKIPKPAPPEGKSNPSKRHRDRLNGELDRLTSLLPFPQEVRSRLDKLSVLRLSVGYLKVKSFFNATLQKHDESCLPGGTAALRGNGKTASAIDGVAISEGELLLQALSGFVLVVTAEGYIFYASPTIQDYLGFHQSDVVHQSVFEMIHSDDRAMFRGQLHFALNPNQGDPEQGSSGMQSSQISSNIVTYDPQLIPPENSSFLERSFCCRFRCLLDNSSGFLALNFHGRLKYLHGQNQVSEDGKTAHSQLALFAIAAPVQPPAILEIRTKTLIFQTKHKLDFSPMGIDTRGKVVLGYSETELCMKGSGYQFIHAADMMYCADNHMKMIKTGESGFSVFRLLAKSGLWVWVQATARLVFKGGRPDFVIARQRPLTNEEGEEHFRKRRLQLPFDCASGEGVLYDVGPSLDMMDANRPETRSTSQGRAVDPMSLLGSMLNQDQSAYIQPVAPDPQDTLDRAFMDSHALLSVPGDAWQLEAPTPGGHLKQDSTLAGIMESLEQIMSDSGLGAALEELEVDDSELKEWENALLKMNGSSSSDTSLELSRVLANDIFSYVEEALFKENPLGPCRGDAPREEAGVPSGCFGEAFSGTSRGLPGVGLRNSGLPGDRQNAVLSAPLRQTRAFPQVDWVGMGEQNIVGLGTGVGGMQEAISPDPLATMRLNGPRVAHNDGGLPQRQPGFSAQTGLSHNNPMPYNLTLATPCTQTQVNQFRQGLPSSQTAPRFGSCPQQKLRSAPSSTVSRVPPDSLAPSLQNQQQQQPLGIVGNYFGHQTRHNFIGQSNHATLEVQQDQWTPSIPNTNFEDNLQDVWAPNFPSNPSPGQYLQGRFSVQTQSLPSEPLHPWQPRQEVPTVMHSRQRHPLPQQPDPDHQDFPSGASPQTSQNCRTSYGYRTQNAVPALSSSVNGCMFDGGPPSTGECFGIPELGMPVLPYQKLNPSNSQSSPQASFCFQNFPGNMVLGSSTSGQGSGQPRLPAPGVSPGDTMPHHQFLNCNGQPQVPGHPTEDEDSFSFPPLSNGTTYFSENNQTNCCDF